MTVTALQTLSKRCTAIDNLRGLAIALMILDHLLIVFVNPSSPIRMTITRLAMPIFFVLAGHLCKRLSWRLLLIGVVGVLLPTYVSFIDNPNVLLWYALFAPAIVFLRKYPAALIGIVVFSLTAVANYMQGSFAGTYYPPALFAFMALGAMMTRSLVVDFARYIPKIPFLGMYPLTIYVVHLLILEQFA